jgi:hypothetical protein
LEIIWEIFFVTVLANIVTNEETVNGEKILEFDDKYHALPSE